MHNIKDGFIDCELDGTHIRLQEGFWRRSENVSIHVNTMEHITRTKLDSTIGKIVRNTPLPAVISPLQQFAILFSPELERTIFEVMDEVKRDSKVMYSLNLGSLGHNVVCYELGGYCSPEFSSCIDCYNTLFYDPSLYWPWPQPKDCVEQYLDLLHHCRANHDECKSHCQEFLTAVAPATGGNPGHNPVDIEVPEIIWSCMDTCFDSYLHCVVMAQEYFEWCVRNWGF